MASVVLEKSEAGTTLNPALLSVFAKATYLKQYNQENMTS